MTFNPPNLRTIGLIAAGFALKFLSRSLELQGDAASESGTRLFYHLTALLLLLAAFGCFVWALKAIFFTKRADAPPSPESRSKQADSPQGASEFDPDAALARYMSERQEPGDTKPNGSGDGKKPGGFGRRGL